MTGDFTLTPAITTVVDQLNGVTGNTTTTIPAGWQLVDIVINNTTANAVTGGIKVGTTSGATDVLAALAVGANALVSTLTAVLVSIFSVGSSQTLFIQAVVAWNSASVDIRVVRRKVF